MSQEFCIDGTTKHYEILSTPEVGKPIIGRCKKCGREINYTERQMKYNIIFNQNVIPKGATYENIVKVKNGLVKKR